MTIKRFKVTHQTQFDGLLVEASSGDWVRWEDVKRLLPRDSHAQCPICLSPPAAPCYPGCRNFEPEKPIDMVLFCPRCHQQHIDAPHHWSDKFDAPTGDEAPEDRAALDKAVRKYEAEWTNPPHRSHECQHCKFTWRPADVPTNGVAAVKTKGQRDDATCDPERPGCGVTTHCNGACHGVMPDGSPK